MNQQVFSSYKSYQQLKEILKEINPEKILLVTGKNSYSISGAEKTLSEIFALYNIYHFNEHKINCQIEDVITGIAHYKDENCDLIIGIGGGTTLDLSKAISLLATQEDPVEEYIKGAKKVRKRQIKTILIPTTAGSGSEATHFSVIYIDHVKYSLAHKSLISDYVILDPTFILNLPADITAYTGMDALCQAIESFWSIQSTEESKTFSQRAIHLILEKLVASVKSPTKTSREQMLMASHYAGQAINISKTTAAHAISYPLTTLYGIPHGHAVALTLPYFMKFNYLTTLQDVQDKRGVDFVKKNMAQLLKMLGVNDINQAFDMIKNLMKDINLFTDLKQYALNQTSIDNIFHPHLD